MQVLVCFVEVFFSSHEQSILKVECDCLPEIESYGILALLDLATITDAPQSNEMLGWDLEFLASMVTHSQL